MKKALLSIIDALKYSKIKAFCAAVFCLLGCVCYAYETVLVDFPQGQGWHSTYYDTQGDEAILQYVPVGQNSQNWTKSVIFHSYKNPSTDSSAEFMNTTTTQMELQNSSQMYKYLKYTEPDSIATRCIKQNKNTPTQCEIYRVSDSYEGLISMHYINKNVSDFKSTFDMWYQIIKDIRIYYSYYRDDRILDKATSFEL